MSIYLIGGNGRLGHAIAHHYADAGIVSLPRSVYESWSEDGATDSIARYFDRLGVGDTIFVASGLLDPRLPQDQLLGVNYRLPKNVIDGVAPHGIKVVTFGTTMECLLDSGNAYVQSKRRLGEYVGEKASATMPLLHLQLHTLYGIGQPSSFMFLGQMLAALRSNELFRMTSGLQLREYHHLEDEARAIRLLADAPGKVGTTSLSHGKPVSLRAIAEAVFMACGKIRLLRIGALPDPAEENYGKIFAPTTMLSTIKFRDSIEGVVQYMRMCSAVAVSEPGNIRP